MEFITLETYLSELVVAYFDFRGVMIGVKGRFHNQSVFRRGVGDQINNYFKVYERAGAPFLVMKLNRRCSILFHLLVPGGK